MSEVEQRRIQTMVQKSESVVAPFTTTSGYTKPVVPFADLKTALDEFDREEQLPPLPDDPSVVGSLMKNARVLVEAGESRLAFNILRNVLMRVPDHGEALGLMAHCLREAGRNEDALKCFRALVVQNRRENREVLTAQIGVAECLYVLERDEQALSAYSEILKNVIEDETRLFEILKNVGNLFVRAGDYDSAEEFYNRAYTLKPNSDVLFVNFGTLEIQRENIESAAERFRTAVQINPNNDKAWVGLAMVHRMKGDFGLSVGNIECALDIAPTNRTAIRLLIDWCWADQRFDTIIQHLQRYVGTTGAEDAEMCFHLAKVLTQVGRFRDARLETERVLALDPSMTEAESLCKALDRELNRRESIPTEGV